MMGAALLYLYPLNNPPLTPLLRSRGVRGGLLRGLGGALYRRPPVILVDFSLFKRPCTIQLKFCREEALLNTLPLLREVSARVQQFEVLFIPHRVPLRTDTFEELISRLNATAREVHGQLIDCLCDRYQQVSL